MEKFRGDLGGVGVLRIGRRQAVKSRSNLADLTRAASASPYLLIDGKTEVRVLISHLLILHTVSHVWASASPSIKWG